MLNLKTMTRVPYDDRHNAFTDLAFWKGHWFLAFRTGKRHASPDGKIALLRSPNLESWTEAKVFSTDADDRDPKLLATPERLFVYHFARKKDKGQELKTPLMHWTEDGDSWSGPDMAFKENWVQWRPRLGPDRAYYAAFHTVPLPGRLRQVALFRSADGFAWEEVSPIWSSYNANETAVEFAADGELVALVRGAEGVRNMPSEKAVLAFSRPPYVSWEYEDSGISAGGPALANLGGTVYAAARKFRWSPRGERLPSVTTLYLLRCRILHEFLTLPSGGDCSYAALAETGDGDVAISYYSSHEGRTSAYVARLGLLPRNEGHTRLAVRGHEDEVDANMLY